MSHTDSRFEWGHINLNVSDLERSIAFYAQFGFEVFMPAIPYLGLDLEPDPKPLSEPLAQALGLPEGTRGRACILQLNDGFPKLDLTTFSLPDSAAPLQTKDTGLVRICLSTSDLDGEVARLKAAGVSFLTDPQSGHAQLADIALCRDPDGTLIELLQVYLHRWQSLLNPS